MPSAVVQLNTFRDAALLAFEDRLEEIIRRAQQATLDYVMQRVEIEDGVVTRTPGNLKVLRRLNQIFMQELNKAGYNTLLNAFVSQFPGQLPMMQEAIKNISDAQKTPLPDLQWSTEDLNLFKSVATSSTQAIKSVVQSEATRALNKVMFSMGNLPFKTMVSMIQENFGATISRAKVIADTAQAQFYRIAQQRQYETIQKANPGATLLYKYTGPNDSRCRKFCHNLKNNSKQKWTRAEIDQMDNGQIPDVFISCGGFECRHQFDLAGVSST